MNQSTQSTQLAAVRALAHLLDNAFRVPGTNVRIGLDAILGLFPGIGDALSAAAGFYIVMVASQMGVPQAVLTRMSINLAVDGFIGAIPLIGDLFDVAWRANIKNLALLERALEEPHAARRSSVGFLIGLGLAILFLVAGGIALVVWLISLLDNRGA